MAIALPPPEKEPETLLPQPKDKPSTTTAPISTGALNVDLQGKTIPVSGKIPTSHSGTVSSTEIEGSKVTMMVSSVKRSAPNTPLDPKFICSTETYSSLLPKIQAQLLEGEAFDTGTFLRGPKGSTPEDQEKNNVVLRKYVDFFTLEAANLSKAKGITLEDAYKLLISALDTYDVEARALNSTFALRTALLLSAGRKGASGIESWMVYTGAGKPAGNIWPFLENFKNWIPEAQGTMAKFSEALFVKAKGLSMEYPEDRVILLKGGFGSGKSRLIAKLLGDKSSGVTSPDGGKRAVRRTDPSITHATAHIQGSNLAYALFDGMINNVTGTVVYDSSLSNPTDIQQYLEKARKAGKKLTVVDVARTDSVRILSVLRREVSGEDPRIPPAAIISATLRDKINRAECMNIIVNDKTALGNEAEYRYYSADASGFNTEQVMILTSNQGIRTPNPEMLSRLELEGITYDPNTKKFRVKLTKEEIESTLKKELARPVTSIVAELPSSEQADFIATFGKRVLLNRVEVPITNSASFYAALPDKIKNAIPEKVIVDAFNVLPPKEQAAFFSSLVGKEKVSYLDLPLAAALTIHHNLQNDPWI